MAQLAVISLGRTRPMLACRRASSNDSPSCMSDRVCAIRTRPFCTAIPKRPMKPTAEETFERFAGEDQSQDAADEGIGQREQNHGHFGQRAQGHQE